MATAVVGTMAIKLAAKTAQFQKDMGKASGALERIGAAASKAAKLSAIGFAAFGGALATVTKFASEQLRVERQLAAAFKATGNELDLAKFKEFASGLQRITTVGDETTIGLAAMLAPFGLLQHEIEALIPRIVDLSAATGMSLQGATMGVARAISTGATGALTRYGISLTDAEKKTFELGNQAARTALLVQKLAVFQGQAAAQATTAAGRADQLSNSFGDLLEEIGKVVDSPLATLFGLITIAIEKFTPFISGAAGRLLLFGTIMTGLGLTFGTVIALFPKIAAGFAVMRTAITGVTAAATAMISLLIAGIGLVRLLAEIREKGVGAVRQRLGITDETGIVSGLGKILAESVTKGLFVDKLSAAVASATADAGKQLEENMDNNLGAAADRAAANLQKLSDAADSAAGEIEFDFAQIDPSITAGLFDDFVVEDLTIDFGMLPGNIAQGIQEAVDEAFRPEPVRQAGPLRTGVARPEGFAAGVTPVIDIVEAQGAMNEFAGMLEGTGVEISESGEAVGQAINIELMDFASQIGAAGAMIGNTMIRSAGNLGSLINSAIQGAQVGGVFGAIGAVLADLVTRSDSFNDTVAHANEAVDAMVEGLEPLAEAMEPIAGITNMLIRFIGEQLGPLFESMEPIFNAVFQVMRVVMIGILNIFSGLGRAWNAIVGAIQAILEGIGDFEIFGKKPFGFLNDWAAGLERATINLNGIDSQIAELHNTTADSIRGEIDAAAARANAKDETKKFSDSLRELNNEIANAPQGFRVDLRRFQSTQGETFAPDVDAGGGGRTAIFNIEALDLEDAARKLRNIEDFQTFTAGASNLMRMPFAVARQGG